MPGKTFEDIKYSDWKVVRRLGSGSFGTVYEIERDNFGHKEKAALKVISIPVNDDEIENLRSENYTDKDIAARFRNTLESVVREYSIMAEMRGCSNIVCCDDIKYVQHDDGIGWDIYIRMELLTPLKKALGKHNATEAQTIKIGKDICNALVYCEKEKILHRDIKPENIFVSKDGTCKLGDFGVAKTVEHTTKGSRKGTAQYMSPEVWYSQQSGRKADIYSLGMVLYWLLNEKRTPFLRLPPYVSTVPEEEAAEKRRFAGEEIPAPAYGSGELQAIVLKACAYDPNDRYEDAAEMLQALSALRCGSATFDTIDFILDSQEAENEDSEDYGTMGADGESADIESNGTIGAYDSNTQVKKSEPKKWPKILAGVAAVIVLAVLGYFNIHIWRPATCTTPKTCSICGKTEGEALGHKWVEATESAAKTCSVCGATEGSALEHEWGEPIYTWSDDYSTVIAQRVCSHDDSHIETETVKTTGKVTKAATCETKGKTTYTAVFRNSAFSKQTKTIENISATGHKWGEPTYKWSEDNSTVTATRVCAHNKSHIDTETIKTTSKVTKAATCGVKGETTYTAVFKNSAFTVQKKTLANIIPTSGHKWLEATIFAPKTCSVCGKTEGIKKTFTAGDYISFGSYEQDNDLTNGKESIEWLVLDIQNGKALFISRYALDSRIYDKVYAETENTWEQCTLRTFLNGTFLNKAFSTEEQKRILTSTVSADKNPSYSTNPGNSTSDKVFLLSIMEVNKYLSSDSVRQCKPTAYAERHGCDSFNGNCWWWLRSPGIDWGYTACVGSGGSVETHGRGRNMSGGAVRPAIWIDLGS